jgi:hypothetical protein
MPKKVETRVFLDPELDAQIASQAAAAGLTKPKYIALVLAGIEQTDPEVSKEVSINPEVSKELSKELSDIRARLTTLEQTTTVAQPDQDSDLYEGQVIDGQMGKLYSRLKYEYDAKTHALGCVYYANNTLGIVYKTNKDLTAKSGKAKFIVVEVFEDARVVITDGAFGAIELCEATEDRKAYRTFSWEYNDDTEQPVLSVMANPELVTTAH